MQRLKVGQVRRLVTIRGVVSLILSCTSFPCVLSLAVSVSFHRAMNETLSVRQLELCKQDFALFPVDHEFPVDLFDGIRIRSGVGSSFGRWFQWFPSHGEISQEFLAVIRSLAAGDQVRCLLVQRGVPYF